MLFHILDAKLAFMPHFSCLLSGVNSGAYLIRLMSELIEIAHTK